MKIVKIAGISRNVEELEEIKKEINLFSQKFNHKRYVFVKSFPDLVIAYGGDGTLLIAERKFPGIPKVLIKKSKTCRKGQDLHIKEILKRIENKDYKIKEIQKIKAKVKTSSGTKELIAINDLVIRNTLPTEAIRFKLFINNKEYGEFIGDGLVIATPFGSTAYFNSITRKTFKKGIGIAFNNTHDLVNPTIINEKSKIKIVLLRGPAVLVGDNNRDFINLEDNDKIIIQQTKQKAKMLVF